MSYVRSGNPRVEELTKSFRERNYRLSDLYPQKDSTGKKICCWCMGPLKGNRHKWCSKNCTFSALAWARPCKEEALNILLMQQNWKCNYCKYDYTPLIEQLMINGRVYRPPEDYRRQEAFWLMKRLRQRCEKTRRPEIDHIIPICLGGIALGQSNCQVLCCLCHREKTKQDIKEKFRIYGNPRKGVPQTEAHKEALSKARKGKDSEVRRKNRELNLYPTLRIQICATNLKTGECLSFESIRAAALQLNLQESCISQVLANKQGRTQHKGWQFKRLDK